MRVRQVSPLLLALAAIPAVANELYAQLPVLGPGARGDAVSALQVALSNRDFSPGAIDGNFGPMVVGALRDYQKSRGLTPDGIAGPAVWADLGISPEAAADAAFRQHTVTPADTAAPGGLPEDWRARAELPFLPYESVIERLAERHQSTRDYLSALNPDAGWPNPVAGTTIRVPAVVFETVEAEAQSSAVAPDAAVATAREGVAQPPAAAGADSALAAVRAEWEQRAPAGVEVWVSTRKRVVRVYENGKLVARYPATVGSRQFPNPRGEWKIVSQVYAPDYRYDEAYLETGRRSEGAVRVPPGPNNIVGLMWMGLNKEGFGLHGTDEPETIGAAASHGCVRLTNWDAERLARRVGIGTPVAINP